MKTKIVDWTETQGPLKLIEKFNYNGFTFEYERHVVKGDLGKGVVVAIDCRDLGCPRVKPFQLVVAKKDTEYVPKGTRGLVTWIHEPWTDGMGDRCEYVRVWFEGQSNAVNVMLTRLDLLGP